MRRRPALWILFLVFSAACLSSAVADETAPRPTHARWGSEMQGTFAEGTLYRVKKAELVVWNQGFYDETADALEVAFDGVRFPAVPVSRTFDLECRTYLSFAEATLSEDRLPWARAGEHIRLVLRDELYSRCAEFPVHPWTLKMEIRNAAGEVITRAEFRGQPYRIPR